MNFLDAEVQEVLSTYPGLKKEVKNEEIKLTGNIEINNTYNDVHIIDDYRVEIYIPKEFPKALPRVRETGKKVKSSFGHIYNNRELCLATFADMQLKLGENFRLVEWIEFYVIPYFFSYSYYNKYGVLPFGERSHGVKGIIEFYIEYFGVDNNISAKNILKYVCKKNYRGHDSCPCGSGKRVRDCHKDIILFCKEDSRLDVLQNDFRYIEKERR